jgi:hypothetical protein
MDLLPSTLTTRVSSCSVAFLAPVTSKHCVINAFETNYLISADEVMASILHLEQDMDEEVTAPGQSVLDKSAPSIPALVASGRGTNSGRGHNPRGTRGGRGLPKKCSACGNLNHILSSCSLCPQEWEC